jgi:YaiO family outer membrane protein
VAARPGELDFQIGLGDTLRAQARDEEARAAFEVARGIDPTSIDVRNRLAVRDRPRWRLDLDGSYSWLTQGLDPWQEGRIGLGYVVNGRTTVSAGVEVNRRFRLVDVLVDGRVDHRFSNRLMSYLRAGFTPDADFRPRFLAQAGGSAQIAPRAGVWGQTLATLDLGYARYNSGESKPRVRVCSSTSSAGASGLTGRLIGTISETGDRLGGYLVRTDWAATDAVTVFVGYSDAPDASEGRTFETRSVFGGIALAVTEDLTLRASLAHDERDRPYDRTTVNLGLTSRY